MVLVIFMEITDWMIDRNEAKWYILNLVIEGKIQWHDVIGKMNHFSQQENSFNILFAYFML